MEESDSQPAAFTLKGEDDAFSARRDSVFASLPTVQLNTSTRDTESATSSSVSDRHEGEQEGETVSVAAFKGEESMFKRPMPKLKRPSHPPRKHSYPARTPEPDHKRNPQKWTKYSLADTPDMCDKSNAAAALSFLRELEERKRGANPTDEDEKDNDGKVVFKKPKSRKDLTPKSKTYRDGKLVMPAFEFGTKKQSRRNSKLPSSKSDDLRSANCSLSHLQQHEDD